MQQGPAQTVVQQGQQRGIVDWRSFNVGQDHTVRFQQPGASSITLNRVTTRDPSTIAGRITANGQIAIVNQSGVVFAKAHRWTRRPDRSRRQHHQPELHGRADGLRPAPPARRAGREPRHHHRRRGRASPRWSAPQRGQSGIITARLGRVALAGGAETYCLDLAGDGMLAIDVTRRGAQPPPGGGALVTNTGVIDAQGGTILLTAQAASGLVEDLVRASGRISADTDAATGRTGRIAINGTGGAVRVEGEVRAAGNAPGTRGGRSRSWPTACWSTRALGSMPRAAAAAAKSRSARRCVGRPTLASRGAPVSRRARRCVPMRPNAAMAAPSS